MSKPTHRRCKAAYRSCCASVQYRPPDLAAAEDVRGADGISNQTGWSCGQDSAAPRSGRVAALANRGGLCETQINHDTLQDGCHTPCDALHRSQLPCGNATTCDPHITRQFNSATAVIAQQGTTSSTSKIDAAPALLRCEHRHATHISVHVTRTRVQNSMIMAPPVVYCCCWCITAVAVQRCRPLQTCSRWAAGRYTAARASCSRLRPAIPQ